MKKQENYAYVNGEIVSSSEAKVSCFDRGVTHGWAVYEGLRVYDGLLVQADEHINRFFDSAKAAVIKIPLSKEELKKTIIKTVKANGYKNCHIRPWVSYGTTGDDPTLFILVVERGEAYQMGKVKTAVVSQLRRPSSDSIDSKIKTNSRLDLCLAGWNARRVGASLAIMLDKSGFIAEVSMANIFLVKNNVVYTPFTTSALEGVTRELVMNLLSDDGYTVKEKNLTLQDLYTADEVFTCGTGEEINSLVQIDGRTIGNGKVGPITLNAIELYVSFIKENAVPIY